MKHLRSVTAHGLAAMLALGVLFMTGPAISAQEATPPPTDAAALTAAIHQGTCDEIGPVLAEIDDFDLDEEAEDGEAVGAVPESPILLLDEDVEEVGFDALLSEALHAIVVQDDTGTPVACGDIGGIAAGDELTVALRPIEDSDYAGIAHLEEDVATLDIGDDEVEIEIYLFQL